jgi:hypothetical protein
LAVLVRVNNHIFNPSVRYNSLLSVVPHIYFCVCDRDCLSLIMSVRPVLLKDIRRTAINSHVSQTGKGNYNRFGPLDRGRTYSTGKRQLSATDNPEPPYSAKAPRIDANLIFDQLKGQDAIFAEAKTLLATAVKSGEDAFSATDGGIGTAISCLTKLLTLVLQSQENLTSALIDSVNVSFLRSFPFIENERFVLYVHFRSVEMNVSFTTFISVQWK